jgi:hypothetical protein
MSADFRCCSYADVLADVQQVDAVICDPPYGARTHANQTHGRKRSKAHAVTPSVANLSARGLSYAHWSLADVDAFVDFMAPRCRGWFCAMTSHDLVPAYELALARHDRYVFAPLACVQHAMNVRLGGDGPSNWTVWLVVARPRSLPFHRWGTLPGAYVGPSTDRGENALDRSKRAVAGAKPLWLMQAIVRDYSRPGDLVCDPTAGGATTLLAALTEGRRAIGAELDPETHAKGAARLARGYTPTMFAGGAP